MCGRYSQPRRLQRKEAMIHRSAAHKYRLLIVLTVTLTVGVIVPQRSSSRAAGQQGVIHQLRIYEIFDSNKKAFHDRFRDHALRIMAKYDFKIVATWESKKDNRTEFVYLLEWPDRETMADRWDKFLRDQEWIKIKKETSEMYGTLVGDIQDRTLYLTDYSPRTMLAK
jgi:NIPSNAP protein